MINQNCKETADGDPEGEGLGEGGGRHEGLRGGVQGPVPGPSGRLSQRINRWPTPLNMIFPKAYMRQIVHFKGPSPVLKSVGEGPLELARSAPVLPPRFARQNLSWAADKLFCCILLRRSRAIKWARTAISSFSSFCLAICW